MGKPFVPATNELTWDAIKAVVGKFKPSIAIEDYVDLEAPKAIEVLD